MNKASTPNSKARLLAATRKESGAWLHALPSPVLGTLLDDNSNIRIAVGLRLGTFLCHPHKCRCGEEVDDRGTHGLSCQLSAGRLSRHAALNDIIKRACAHVNVPSILEPTGLFRSENKRPDGLTLTPWSMGKCLVWDATCSDTLAKSHLPSTSHTPGAAAAKAEKRKYEVYSDMPKHYIFCPFAVETLGPLGEDALKLVRELGRRIHAESGDSRSTSFLFQRISLAIQRGNAASVFGTIPPATRLFKIL